MGIYGIFYVPYYDTLELFDKTVDTNIKIKVFAIFIALRKRKTTVFLRKCMRKTSPESIILFTDNQPMMGPTVSSVVVFLRVGVRQLLYQKEIKDVGKI